MRRAVPDDLDWIKPMADRHRDALGFVTRAALASGTLLVPDDGSGFVRFHRRRDGWHTVYDLVSERPGNGRLLLEAVPRPRRLRCPTDLAANGFYAHVGGRLVRTEPGRRRALNVWEWPT